MKTSNIILLAIFASILIWVFAVFMTAKAKMHELTDNLPENEKNEIIEKSTNNAIKLADFHTIKIFGNGNIGIMQFTENNASMVELDDTSLKVEDGILYVNLENDKRIILRAKSIKNILIEDDASLNISTLKADTLMVNTKNYSKINVQSLNANVIKLKSENKSKVNFININNTVPEAEFEIKDNSEVTINNTKGMLISVKKGANAKYEDN